MDNETKQWIFDRIIWIGGLAVSVLIAATAIAGEHSGVPGPSQISTTAHMPAVALVSRLPVEAQ